jgi:predicted nucleic acid-binding protein
VVIPALASWHEAHPRARAACRGVTTLAAHAMLEAVSVLTRLPGGLALATAPAVAVVRRKFPAEPMALTGAEFAELSDLVAAAGLRGGQIYDALIAVTAQRRGMRLLTLDTRAVAVYRAVGADFEML